jgi:hypothetical protein
MMLNIGREVCEGLALESEKLDLIVNTEVIRRRNGTLGECIGTQTMHLFLSQKLF